ncbi:hypothetical protein ABVK25_002398 [Lepraria finkii]|uniref:Uncharacterized protein n=1 Tax=Lepraria finkii TaxID=1340010 RepID=A0ABR4BI64_9LECA
MSLKRENDRSQFNSKLICRLMGAHIPDAGLDSCEFAESEKSTSQLEITAPVFHLGGVETFSRITHMNERVCLFSSSLLDHPSTHILVHLLATRLLRTLTP